MTCELINTRCECELLGKVICDDICHISDALLMRDPCADAERLAALPSTSLAQLAAMLNGGDGAADSDERVLSDQAAILTTNICIQRLGTSLPSTEPILTGSWFRYLKREAPQRRTPSLCHHKSESLPLMSVNSVGGAWLPEERLVMPCDGTPLRRTAPRATYCWTPDEWRHAPHNETSWLRGMTLISAERHISNFHHWSRDLMFWNRFVRRGFVPVSRLLVTDIENPPAWGLEHLKATMPATLINQSLWNADMLIRTNRHAGKRRISRGVCLPTSRYVCFESMVQHVHDYTSEAPDLMSLRDAAYRHCAVTSHPPNLLVLEVRQHSSSDNATTRRLANVGILVSALSAYASSRLGLNLSVRHFGRLSYCQQVALMSQTKLFVGVHGQAQENSIFMPPGSMLLELFHSSYTTELSHEGFGREALMRGSDSYYASGGILELECPQLHAINLRRTLEASKQVIQGAWKFDPRCASHLDPSRLISLLERIHRRLADAGRLRVLSPLKGQGEQSQSTESG